MNSFGRIFKLNIYGESHGDEIGVILDGVPSGIKVMPDCFVNDINRRKPGLKATTSRVESDEVVIKSGVFNGNTTGAPMLLSFKNNNVVNKDYDQFKDIYRPGHVDFVTNAKYNAFNDYRGSGIFSGRLTAPIVAAGVIAKKIVNFDITSSITNLNGVTDENKFDRILDNAIKEEDSVGGIVKVVVKGVDVGLGEPFFDSLESYISHLLFSIGGIKGVSFGVGFDGVSLKGSEFNDVYIDKKGTTKTNNNGGINGGITNGNDLVINVFVKPTSSISKEQFTYNFTDGKMDTLKIKGRHDKAFILRTPVVLEACVMIALADLFLISKTNK